MNLIKMSFTPQGGVSSLFNWKRFLPLSLLAAGLLTFSACQEPIDPVVPTVVQSTQEQAKNLGDNLGEEKPPSLNCEAIKSAVYNDNGVLVFQNMEHFWKCAECLEQDYDKYNDAHDEQFPSLTPQELDAEDATSGFDEWTPFIEFEQERSFSSLRAKVEAEIVAWLQTPADQINFEDDPDDSVPIIVENVRTLFNEQGYAQVDGELFSMTYFAGGEEDNFRSFEDDCGWFTSTTDNFFEEDHFLLENRRLKIKIGIRSGLVSSNLYSRMTHYRLEENNWSRSRTSMRLSVAGTAFSGDCELLPSSGWQKAKGFKKRKSMRLTASIWKNWREAVVEPTNPLFPTRRCATVGLIDNGAFGNAFPVVLVRD